MKYRKLYKGIMLISLSVALTACNDWLDVKPKSEVEDSELFESETGFKEALSGVYSSMVGSQTYSKEMLFGALSILGQEWDAYPSSYSDFVEYDYSASASESLIAGIWSTSYNSIANVNSLLTHIDKAKGLFYNDNYSIIKGEALALRAFLHFDLLRCFGVSYAVNSNMPSIPYCTSVSYRVAPQLSVKEVAEKIEIDLLEAEKLLAVDPILTGQTITELDDNGYLMNRQVHMNYYAVKGLQARLYMWMNKYPEAKQCAETVIRSECFEWATESNMRNEIDLSFATEQLFALNNINLSQIADSYFVLDNSSSSFTLNAASWNELYESEPGDYRYSYLFQYGLDTQVSQCYTKKFLVGKSTESYYTNKMPLIRLSEMYLIKAECEYRENNINAYQTLNALRLGRNVTFLYESNPVDFYGELVNEYRKELIGEGQLFFLYKRLNMSFVIGSSVDMIGTKSYTFPLPVSETDAAQRNDNR